MRGELLEAERVHSIVGAFFKVYNYYGFGLNESIYAGALEYELLDPGHTVVRELAVPVAYMGRATPFEVGVLLHFGPSPKFERFVDFPKTRSAERRIDGGLGEHE
jgi:PD-(D/E)XK nuclease superfamily